MVHRIIYWIKLLLIKLLPIQKGRFLFTSFDGHYSDSPQVLSEVLHKNYPVYRIIWLLNEEYIKIAPEYVTKVKYNGFCAAVQRGRAHIIIDNVYGQKSTELRSLSKKDKFFYAIEKCLKNKPGQKVYSTWHGTPLKKMGRDQVCNRVEDFLCADTTLVLSNEHTKKIMERLTFCKARILLMGCPRNDILFRSRKDLGHIKKSLGFSENQRIVLYAPTFRSDPNVSIEENIRRSGIAQMELLKNRALTETLSKRFGGDWTLVCRFHYHVEKKIDWNKVKKSGDRIVNGNMIDNMSYWLAASDILITDASSCMFDYAITERPCFLFFPDKENYIYSERGIYISFERLPFPIAEDFEGFLSAIERFDEEKYRKELHKMKKMLGYAERPESAQEIMSYIIEENF